MKLPQSMIRNASLLDERLRGMFSGRSFPLYRMIEYQLGWRDEFGDVLPKPVGPPMLHSNLCLLACEATNGEIQDVLHSAIAIELMHQFTQVHADIQDGSQNRYNRPTVWWVWGPAQAINAGDGLHALSRLSMIRSPESMSMDNTVRSLQTFDVASLRMFEGIHEDLAHQERLDISPERYVEIAREKVGSLLGCALELGSMSMPYSSEVTENLRRFGEDIGVAYQIQEDIQMLWGEPMSGKVRGIDALNKRKGFPVILALAQASIKEKRLLGSLFFKRVLTPDDLHQIIAVLDELDAKNRASEVVRQFYDSGIGHIYGANITSQGKDDLIEVAQWLAFRDENA